jgi:hypothetical protein
MVGEYMKNKIFAIIGMSLLVMTTWGATVVSAQLINKTENNDLFPPLFRNRNGPTLDEIIDVYTDLTQSKQEYRDLLDSYGIELPDLPVDEKRQIIRTLRNLRRNGNSKEQIRDEFINILIGYGFNLPDFSKQQKQEIKDKIRTHLEDHYGFVFIELTPEQNAYIKQTIVQLRRQDASQEEIKAEVITLYNGYGGSIFELEDDEKENLYNRIYQLIETDYDYDIPDITYDQRQQLKDKKEEIQQFQKQLRQLFRQSNWLTRIRFYRHVRTEG